HVGSNALEIGSNTLTLARGTAVERNILNGGTGNANTVGDHGPMAVEIFTDDPVDIVNNVIDGGTGSRNAPSIGVHRASGSNGTVRLLGNRIYGGLSPAGVHSVYGVRMFGPGPIELANNMIHAGDAPHSKQPPIAIAINENPRRAIIRHNTLTAPNGYGVFLDAPTRGAVLENNILGAPGEASVAL